MTITHLWRHQIFSHCPNSSKFTMTSFIDILITWRSKGVKDLITWRYSGAKNLITWRFSGAKARARSSILRNKIWSQPRPPDQTEDDWRQHHKGGDFHRDAKYLQSCNIGILISRIICLFFIWSWERWPMSTMRTAPTTLWGSKLTLRSFPLIQYSRWLGSSLQSLEISFSWKILLFFVSRQT